MAVADVILSGGSVPEKLQQKSRSPSKTPAKIVFIHILYHFFSEEKMHLFAKWAKTNGCF